MLMKCMKINMLVNGVLLKPPSIQCKVCGCKMFEHVTFFYLI